MNEHLRERILRKLDSLTDERGYQVLDFVEFLESRYAERQSATAAPFTRFAEAVEDRLRAGKVSATTIAEAMNLMNRAANVLNGALAAGRSVANDIVTATRPSGPGAAAGGGTGAGPSSSTGARPAAHPPGPETSPSPGPGAMSSSAATAPEASSPAHDTKMPGSGEEKL
jgi:hypothetical protein